MARSPVAVTSASESAEHDRAGIESGIPSLALMRSAGMAAAGEIVRRYADVLSGGVLVFAGPGNNGGDAWVVAAALAVAGVPVRVVEVLEPRTPDAQAARRFAASQLGVTAGGASAADAMGVTNTVGAAVIVDGLLGTGSTGAPREPIAGAIAQIAARRAAGARVVALDVPSGVDATSGHAGDDGHDHDSRAVTADLTLTFGTLKRGLLVARGRAGRIVVLDIGLPPRVGGTTLVDASWVRGRVPAIAAESNKGTRRRLAIIAGGPSMFGAAALAARAAHRSGIGLIRLFVAPTNVSVAQTIASDSLAFPWPADDAAVEREIASFAHAVLLGPGLGTTEESRALVDRVLRGWTGPTVVDADALNIFAGRVPALAAALGGRPALITPHPVEFGRLTGRPVEDVLANRFDAGAALAKQLGASVLLKGVPTIVSAPNGDRVVSAAGTPVLAAGGSGDLLAGVAATLLAQTGDPFASAACAAWVHGTAAEIANAGRAVRAVTLDDVAGVFGDAWAAVAAGGRPSYPVIAELPPVGELGSSA